MRTLRRQLSSVVLVAVLAVIGGSCGGDGGSGGGGDGSAELPETLPAGFPIPDSAEIRAGVSEPATGRTLLELSVPMSLAGAVTFFTVELVNAGFVVDRSQQSGGDWVVEFRRGSLRGTVNLGVGSGATEAAITIIDP